MNVRELPGLKTIMGFDGEYANIKIKGTDGIYHGLINRKGEVVWYDHLLLPPLELRDHDSVFLSMKRGVKGFVYFDVAQQKYIDEPQMSERPKDHESHVRSMRKLTDKFLAYAEGPKKWGVKDLEGNIIIPAQFDWVSTGGDDLFIVERDKQYGVIDLKGNWVIPFGRFEWLWWRSNYLIARKDGNAGIVDIEGNTLIPFEYEYLHPAYNEGLDLISAKKDGEFFFINSKQERIKLF